MVICEIGLIINYKLFNGWKKGRDEKLCGYKMFGGGDSRLDMIYV